MRLLLAVDLREECDDVVEQAARWVVRLDAVLDLIYVGIYDDIYEFVTDARMRTMLQAEAEKIRSGDLAKLQRLLDKLPERLRGKALVDSGSPAETIIASQEPYDAVMLATHGRQGVAKLWLGSVAERVVRSTQRPVIVLHVPR